MAADIHSILARWRNHFCQVLNVLGVNDGRQPEIQQTLLVPEASAFEPEMAIEKLKRHISPGIDQIPVDLITTGGWPFRSEIHKLIDSILSKQPLLNSGRSQSLNLFVRRLVKQVIVIIETLLLSTTYKILPNILLSRLNPHAEEIIGDHQCRFWRNRLINIFYNRQILKKKWEYNEALHQLFLYFKKAYDSVRRDVLPNILFEFGIPMKMVRVIKICLNWIYCRFLVGKHLSDMFLIRNGLKHTYYKEKKNKSIGSP